MTRSQDLVCLRPAGLYCPPGDFYIDPWRPVARAVITHAHGDHARTGHTSYLAAAPSEHVLRARLGDITLQTARYGERLPLGDTVVSLTNFGSSPVELPDHIGILAASAPLADGALPADCTVWLEVAPRGVESA